MFQAPPQPRLSVSPLMASLIVHMFAAIVLVNFRWTAADPPVPAAAPRVALLAPRPSRPKRVLPPKEPFRPNVEVPQLPSRTRAFQPSLPPVAAALPARPIEPAPPPEVVPPPVLIAFPETSQISRPAAPVKLGNLADATQAAAPARGASPKLQTSNFSAAEAGLNEPEKPRAMARSQRNAHAMAVLFLDLASWH